MQEKWRFFRVKVPPASWTAREGETRVHRYDRGRDEAGITGEEIGDRLADRVYADKASSRGFCLIYGPLPIVEIFGIDEAGTDDECRDVVVPVLEGYRFREDAKASLGRRVGRIRPEAPNRVGTGSPEKNQPSPFPSRHAGKEGRGQGPGEEEVEAQDLFPIVGGGLDQALLQEGSEGDGEDIEGRPLGEELGYFELAFNVEEPTFGVDAHRTEIGEGGLHPFGTAAAKEEEFGSPRREGPREGPA